METALATPSVSPQPPSLPPFFIQKKRLTRSFKRKKLPHDEEQMSWEEFLDWEPDTRHFKYEWNDGIIETSEYMMKNTERLLVSKLLRVFQKTKAHASGGELFPETDCFFESLQKLRIPDLAYFSHSQRVESSQGKTPVPKLTIEIISPTDRGYRIEAKMHEYFSVGIQVVWHIYPEQKEVRIFTSPKHIEVCSDEDFCGAKPVLMDFQIQAQDLFGEE